MPLRPRLLVVASFASQRVIRTSTAPLENPPHIALRYKFDSSASVLFSNGIAEPLTWDGAGVATVRVGRVEMFPLQSTCCHELHTSDDAFAQIVQAGGEVSKRSGGTRVRLLRKLADRLDGIDVSDYGEGDIIDLPRAEAQLLIAERWAQPFRGPSHDRRATTTPLLHVVAADRSRPRTLEQLRRVREEMETKRCEQQARRRAEDLIREELHDSRAKTVNDDK